MNIAFPHRPPAKGGPGSFQSRFEQKLKEKGWQITYAGEGETPDAIMVVGGTRKVGWLFKNKLKGVPIIVRLDGITWLHKKKQVSTKKWIHTELGKILTQVIRKFFASHIVYQSKFVKNWWQEEGWDTAKSYSIINNGVNLDKFSPSDSIPPISILVVEGNIDYSPYAIRLLNKLQEQIKDQQLIESLNLYGGFENDKNLDRLHKDINYHGRVSREKISTVYHNAVYLSLDVNAACPNAVIEAMASGVPVVGFNTGALKELVAPNAGEVVPYGSDPWELGFPDVNGLYQSILKVAKNWKEYAKLARDSAVKKYSIDDMTSQYIKVIKSNAKSYTGKQKKRIHYFTNIAPHYRFALWALMVNDSKLDFEFYFGNSKNGRIKEMDFDKKPWSEKPSKIHKLKNRRFLDVIIWQSGVLSKSIFSDISEAMLLGDVHIISNWLAAIILRLRGSRVYYWGHGISEGKNSFQTYIRILFNKLAHHHFVYGQKAKETMIKHGFRSSDIHVIYNSLNYKKHKKIRKLAVKDDHFEEFFRNTNLPILVFIGRLTPVKKLAILMQAAHKLNKDSDVVNLLIIGDGPERKELEDMASELLNDGTYHFYGACYDEVEISKLLSNADLCVSPGNVGLTAIHSLSFGTPVCSHNNFSNQMPEHEAIEPDETGFLFEENNSDDLVANIKAWFDRSETRKKVRERCYKKIDEHYNPQNQLKIFKNVFLEN